MRGWVKVLNSKRVKIVNTGDSTLYTTDTTVCLREVSDILGSCKYQFSPRRHKPPPLPSTPTMLGPCLSGVNVADTTTSWDFSVPVLLGNISCAVDDDAVQTKNLDDSGINLKLQVFFFPEFPFNFETALNILKKGKLGSFPQTFGAHCKGETCH